MRAINRVMKILTDKGLKPSKVEADLGLSNGYLAKMEKRGGEIGEETLIKLSSYLENSLIYLMTGEDDVKQEPETASYLLKRRAKKLSTPTTMNIETPGAGIPIYDVPIDASFLERYQDDRTHFEPIGFLSLPKLRNCNFAAVVSGNSMYPIMKSGTIAACRIIENLDYFDEGEMYLIATTNGFETVKYVQTGDSPDELKLIPHNERIKPTFIRKDMVIRVCLVEAWLNFR